MLHFEGEVHILRTFISASVYCYACMSVNFTCTVASCAVGTFIVHIILERDGLHPLVSADRVGLEKRGWALCDERRC